MSIFTHMSAVEQLVAGLSIATFQLQNGTAEADVLSVLEDNIMPCISDPDMADIIEPLDRFARDEIPLVAALGQTAASLNQHYGDHRQAKGLLQQTLVSLKELTRPSEAPTVRPPSPVPQSIKRVSPLPTEFVEPQIFDARDPLILSLIEILPLPCLVVSADSSLGRLHIDFSNHAGRQLLNTSPGQDTSPAALETLLSQRDRARIIDAIIAASSNKRVSVREIAIHKEGELPTIHDLNIGTIKREGLPPLVVLLFRTAVAHDVLVKIMENTVNDFIHDANNIMTRIVSRLEAALEAIEQLSKIAAWIQAGGPASSNAMNSLEWATYTDALDTLIYIDGTTRDTERREFAEILRLIECNLEATQEDNSNLTELIRSIRGLTTMHTVTRIFDVRRWLKEKRIRPLLEKGTEIVIDVPDKVLSVKGNTVQFLRMIENLAKNAREAMDGREIKKFAVHANTVAFSRESPKLPQDMEPGYYVQLIVHDTGCGMSAETVQRIFEPNFSTKPLDDQRQVRGRGMGIIKKVVKTMDGFIRVDSQSGRGTTFSIYLPWDSE